MPKRVQHRDYSNETHAHRISMTLARRYWLTQLKSLESRSEYPNPAIQSMAFVLLIPNNDHKKHNDRHPHQDHRLKALPSKLPSGEDYRLTG